jgi:hypothetical protein
MSQATTVARRLAELSRSGPDGQPVHAPEEQRRLVPLLFFEAGPAAAPLAADPAILPVLQAFCAEVGISSTTSPEEAVALVRRHFEERPLPPALLQELEAILAEVRDEQSATAIEGAARFLGLEVPTVPLAGRERPAGAIGAGPLARFALKTPGEASNDEG